MHPGDATAPPRTQVEAFFTTKDAEFSELMHQLCCTIGARAATTPTLPHSQSGGNGASAATDSASPAPASNGGSVDGVNVAVPTSPPLEYAERKAILNCFQRVCSEVELLREFCELNRTAVRDSAQMITPRLRRDRGVIAPCRPRTECASMP